RSTMNRWMMRGHQHTLIAPRVEHPGKIRGVDSVQQRSRGVRHGGLVGVKTISVGRPMRAGVHVTASMQPAYGQAGLHCGVRLTTAFQRRRLMIAPAADGCT